MGAGARKPHEELRIQPTGSACVADVYRTPSAFRQALLDRINRVAERSPYQPDQLLAQFTYDRFLARVVGGAPDAWVLKGGTSLLARLSTPRHTRDIDLWLRHELTAAGNLLEDLSSSDVGDYITFSVEDKGTLSGQPGVDGRRFRVIAHLDDRVLHRFSVDVVVGTEPTGEVESVASLSPIHMPGITPSRYPAYPIVDHIGDKLAGIMMPARSGHPSSRYRDLVDLARIATELAVDAEALHQALRARFPTLPPTVDVPEHRQWAAGYTDTAKGIPDIPADLEDALTLVRQFLDPVLQGLDHGRWHPTSTSWS